MVPQLATNNGCWRPLFNPGPRGEKIMPSQSFYYGHALFPKKNEIFALEGIDRGGGSNNYYNSYNRT